LLNLYGEQIRRPAAIGWTNDPTVHIRLKDHSWKMVRPEKAVAKSLKTMARTVAVNDPRGSADGTDPGRQERENVIALRPQPPPRRSRGSMLSMIEDYSHAA
jgi:hypothetical protein